MKLSGEFRGKKRTTVTMAMPADGARVRLMSDMCTCGTRERLQPRDTSKVSDGNRCILARATRPAVPPASIWGKMRTAFAFARRAAAAAGAVTGLKWRGARSGAPFDASAAVPRSPNSRTSRPAAVLAAPLCVRRPALDHIMAATPSCAPALGARAPRPAASRYGSVAIAVRKAEPSRSA